jgi:hypothetical protein
MRRVCALTVRMSSVPHAKQASVTSSRSSASGVGATETRWSSCVQQGQATTIVDAVERVKPEWGM